jgi:hypothetical protein
MKLLKTLHEIVIHAKFGKDREKTNLTNNLPTKLRITQEQL